MKQFLFILFAIGFSLQSYAAFTVTIDGVTIYACPQQQISLTANATGSANTPYTYSWSTDSGSLSSLNLQNTTLTFGNSNTTVNVTVTDALGNSVTASDTIQNGGINIQFIGSNPISLNCGASATLTTSVLGITTPLDSTRFRWSTGGIGTLGQGYSSIGVSTIGTYSVTVTNIAHCSSSASISVQYPPGVTNNPTFTYETPICANVPTSFVNTSTYKNGWSARWSFGDGNTDYGDNVFHTYSTSGSYTVTLTVDSCSYGFESSPVTIQVLPQNSPSCLLPPIVAVSKTNSCYPHSGTASAMVTGGFQPYSYLWSNGETSSAIYTLPQGVYSVTVTGSNNVSVSASVTVRGIAGQEEQICIVSVNSLTGKNIVVWEKNLNNIDSFNIYRETNTANVYALINQQLFSSFSTFEDVQSNPQQSSSRYVITTVDTFCGQSAYSTPHRTIHLTSNVGINHEVNLIWNAYEGITYPTFNIYRGSSQSNLALIAQVASGSFSYSDLTPPAPPLYYQIEVINPNGCVPTAKTESFSSSLSNIIQVNPQSIHTTEQDYFKIFTVYENGTGQNKLVINSEPPFNVNVRLFDYSGRLVYSVSNIEQNQVYLPDFISKGIYVVEVADKNHLVRKKICVR